VRRARLFESLGDDAHGAVEIRELDLEIGELDPAQLVQLRAASGHLAKAPALEHRAQRVLVTLAPVDGADVLVETRDDEVRVGHRSDILPAIIAARLVL
jgi:hypothetical protein